MVRRERLAFGLALATVVVVPGLAAAALTSLGRETLGSVAWALGYGGGALLVWYLWLRPLDLTGPDVAAGAEDEEADPRNDAR